MMLAPRALALALVLGLTAGPVHAQGRPKPVRSCTAEIGAGPAAGLVRECREVSLASRPPCNAQNSCAQIRAEVRQGCALLSEDAPSFCRAYVDDEDIPEDDDE